MFKFSSKLTTNVLTALGAAGSLATPRKIVAVERGTRSDRFR
jgi:hypothetical protein